MDIAEHIQLQTVSESTTFPAYLLVMRGCAGYFGYTFSKKTVTSKVSNSFASCAMERWRVKAYESAIGTGILEQMPSGVNTGWLASGTEGIDSATDKQSLLESGLRQARGKEVESAIYV